MTGTRPARTAGVSRQTRVSSAEQAERGGGTYIQQAAKMVGVPPAKLRAWEREGLVRPSRSQTDYRLYSVSDIQHLQRVRDLFQRDGLNAAGVRRVLAESGALPKRPTPVSESQGIGQRLHALRRERGASLRTLAAETRLSASYISALERSHSSPSVASLHKLATALGTTVVKILGEAEPDADRVVVKPEARRGLDLGIPGVEIEELAAVDTSLEPLLFRVAPQAGSEDAYQHVGEEFLWVLEGSFEVTLDAAHVYRLQVGDAMTFASNRPHSWRNPGDDTAVIVWINTPPTF